MLSSTSTRIWNRYHEVFATSEWEDRIRGIALKQNNISEVGQTQELDTILENEENMGHHHYHRSRNPASEDEGYETTSEISQPSSPLKSRKAQRTVSSSVESDGLGVEPQLRDLGILQHWNESLGSTLSNVRLEALTIVQLRELAELVAERGVVVLRDQELSREEQGRISAQIAGVNGEGVVEEVVEEPVERVVSEKTRAGWDSYGSFEQLQRSYTVARAEEAGGETSWISLYGLYDDLSKPMRRFLDGLEVAQNSTNEDVPTIITLPAVATHPLTNFKTLNAKPANSPHFPDLSPKESASLHALLEHNLLSADEHTVRFRWEKGDVAIWDNRCTAYKHIGLRSPTGVKRFETSVGGVKPYFDKHSESRAERVQRLQREKEEEEERREEIRRRFNNTPLRRILRRQALWENDSQATFTSLDSAGHRVERDINAVDMSRSTDNGDSGDGDLTRISQEGKGSEDKAEESIRTVVSSKGSPLRRILQRQIRV
ncbi:Clavaminate synthase-like protein [Plenodomus tracheiphilus IPT5]|uniref:Clavaminate synthase-like protein n=1 Tax=Plenodomus tracheiphilus IPT5 TaxID=1408161 RepID=A0A6A7AW76_9PLEO|nr:Clavaminate synthase-like protein [Plenodomus tracheiphilus IPT5]